MGVVISSTFDTRFQGCGTHLCCSALSRQYQLPTMLRTRTKATHVRSSCESNPRSMQLHRGQRNPRLDILVGHVYGSKSDLWRITLSFTTALSGSTPCMTAKNLCIRRAFTGAPQKSIYERSIYELPRSNICRAGKFRIHRAM